MILAQLESPAAMHMLAAANACTDIAEKWQRVNTVLIQSTLQVVGTMGFTADAQGFESYTRGFADHVRQQPETGTSLQQLVGKKWEVLLKHGYGCSPAPPLSLKEARDLAIDMVDALQCPELLKQVEESKQGLASRLGFEERQHIVARVLVREQVEVLTRHGYSGTEGFAQAQVCLMEHAADAVVSASVATATHNLYARAGIDLVSALRGATGG